MIVAFSTSSPQTSVALLTSEGSVLAARQIYAPMQASAACVRLLEDVLKETGRALDEATFFAADRGPGSFTGVKVAVTMAKTMAFAYGVKCFGADSFDLVSPSAVVVVPSKRGEWFVRYRHSSERIAEPRRQTELPNEDFMGYGPGIVEQHFPNAAHFADVLGWLEPIEPELLVPNYLIDPSISKPKAPLSPLGGTRA